MKTRANPRRVPRRWAERPGAAMLIYVTCPGRRAALRIARAALGERLAACANLIGPMRSLFRWQGRVQAADEVVLILKTTGTLSRRLGERVAALHPYTVPCVVALPIAGGHAPFLDWIADATAPASARR
jgi:periplasmic divalent cation tolerance protein